MNGLIIALFALLAVAAAAPSGWGHGGAVIAGPAGVVTGHGPIAGAVVAGPAWGGWGHGWGHGLLGWGHGGVHVQGPVTVPATIAGPSGAIHASGLWGAHHGHLW